MDKIIKEITFPSLEDTNYASNLQGAFDNINKNFALLANQDFIKGESGESVNIKEIDLDSNKEWQKKFKIAILNQNETSKIPAEITDEELNKKIESLVINGISVFPNSLGKLYLINKYSVSTVDTDNIISSLHYVFLDNRFTSLQDCKTLESYNNAFDYSCIIQFDKGELQAIQSFPTLYYDEANGFCWKFNGKETGLSAQGIPGKNGVPGYSYVVKAKPVTTKNGVTNNPEITHIITGENGYVDIKEAVQKDKELAEHLKNATVFVTIDGNEYSGKFWISTSSYNDQSNTYYVYIDWENPVSTVIDINTFYSEILPKLYKENGLYIPINWDLKKIHNIYSTTADGIDSLHIEPVTVEVDNTNKITKKTRIEEASLILGYNKIQQNSCTASGNHSFAEGSSTTAVGQYSHAEGNLTTTFGLGSHAEGVSEFGIGGSLIGVSKEEALQIWNSTDLASTLALGEGSHVEGYNTLTIGDYSHAEGNETKAEGINSHAEGYETKASGNGSHAEGSLTTASGKSAHAEGTGTTASSNQAHAEGNGTTASGSSSHAEGSHTKSLGSLGSHAEGQGTIASGKSAHAEGYSAEAVGEYSHAEGSNTTASSNQAHAEGTNTTASGLSSHIEGMSTNKIEDISQKPFNEIFELWKSKKFSLAKGAATHVEGLDCLSTGNQAHAEGAGTIAFGGSAHAEGTGTAAYSNQAHAEGYNTTALGISGSHVEGRSNINALNSFGLDILTMENPEIIKKWNDSKFSLAKGAGSHVEGCNNLSFCIGAHAEGESTIALGDYSHAEGHFSKVYAPGGHAEGNYTESQSQYSHAEGNYTKSLGNYSHVEGNHTIASGESAHAEGKYNVDNRDWTHMVGIGVEQNKKNAHTITNDGKHYIPGVGGYDGTQADLSDISDVASVISRFKTKRINTDYYVEPGDRILVLQKGEGNKGTDDNPIKIFLPKSLKEACTVSDIKIIKPMDLACQILLSNNGTGNMIDVYHLGAYMFSPKKSDYINPTFIGNNTSLITAFPIEAETYGGYIWAVMRFADWYGVGTDSGYDMEP